MAVRVSRDIVTGTSTHSLEDPAAEPAVAFQIPSALATTATSNTQYDTLLFISILPFLLPILEF